MSAKPCTSVTYLTHAANGNTEHVQYGEISHFARLQLYNNHTRKFFIKKTGKIKIFTKVHLIKDKNN